MNCCLNNCCGSRAYRYTLRAPRITTNFVQYPTCSDVNILAQYGLVDVIFPTETTSNLQVSIVDCRSNTLVYKEDGNPLLGNEVIINTPQKICFNPSVGGYTIYGYVTPTPSVPTALVTTPKKEVTK